MDENQNPSNPQPINPGGPVNIPQPIPAPPPVPPINPAATLGTGPLVPRPNINPAPQPAGTTYAAAPAPPAAPPPLDTKQAKQVKKQKITTQDAVQISEIRDGLVIMRDGSVRAVVMCQSINFDLMSPQEREGVELSYQGFLNSLYFPIQIFIRSQRVDLNNYIDKLQQIHANEDNVLLGLLMEDYIAYVRFLIEAANVMDKQFYVVVPYYPPMISQEGISSGVRKFGSLFKSKSGGPIVIKEADYARYKAELTQRVQTILSGMNQLGVQAVPLNTQELIELYYAVYNPQTASKERLTNIEDLDAAIITKGPGQASQVLHGENT